MNLGRKTMKDNPSKITDKQRKDFKVDLEKNDFQFNKR